MIVLLLSALRAWLRRHPAIAVALAPFTLLVLVPGTVVVPLALLVARDAAPARPIGTVAAPVAASAPPPRTPAPPSDPDLEQLLRALDEAHRNCEAARALEQGRHASAGEPLFRTVELETALLENPWVVDRALGEADTLLDEAVWLADLEPASSLRERTWEDVRYLLGGIHWYLERAWDAGARSESALRAHGSLAGALAGVPLPEPARHDRAEDAYDRAALRDYHDVPTWEDLLGRWD